jgi:hypothetical protein
MVVEAIDPAKQAERREFRALEQRLVLEFCPPLRAEQVATCIAESIRSFEIAAVRQYVVLLVERETRARLRHLRQLADRPTP